MQLENGIRLKKRETQPDGVDGIVTFGTPRPVRSVRPEKSEGFEQQAASPLLDEIFQKKLTAQKNLDDSKNKTYSQLAEDDEIRKIFNLPANYDFSSDNDSYWHKKRQFEQIESDRRVLGFAAQNALNAKMVSSLEKIGKFQRLLATSDSGKAAVQNFERGIDVIATARGANIYRKTKDSTELEKAKKAALAKQQNVFKAEYNAVLGGNIQPDIDDVIVKLENEAQKPLFLIVPGRNQKGERLNEAAALAQFTETGRYSAVFENPEDALKFKVSYLDFTQEALAKRQQDIDSSVVSKYGLGSAINMLPIIAGGIPNSLRRGMEGAMVGGTLGSVVPGVGTVAGAVTTGIGSAIYGGGEYSYYLESGNIYADLKEQVDKKGNHLSDETIEIAATMGGLASAGIETIGTAALGVILKPAGKFAGDILGQKLADSWAKLAAQEGIMPALARTGIQIFGVGADETVTEGLQEITNIKAEEWAKKTENEKNGTVFNVSEVWEDAQKRVGEAGLQAFMASLWLGGATLGTVKAVNKAADSTLYAKAKAEVKKLSQEMHRTLADLKKDGVPQAKIIELVENVDPKTAESVEIPAQKLLTLYEQGEDLITPLGFNLEDVKYFASKNWNFDIKPSEILAKTDEKQFAGISEELIPKDDISDMSVSEAKEITEEEIKEQATRKANEILNEKKQVETEFTKELKRLGQEVKEAISPHFNKWNSWRETPYKAHQISEGINDYTEIFLKIIANNAERMAALGIDKAKYLKALQVKFSGMKNPKDRAAEMKKTVEQQKQDFVTFGAFESGYGNWTIRLFKNAGPGTLFHETAHFFFSQMKEAARLKVMDKAMEADWAVLQNWFSRFEDKETLRLEYEKYGQANSFFNGKKFEDLTADELEVAKQLAAEESFARAFEAYLIEKKAPDEKMRSLFERIQNWLVAFYRKARSLDVELTDEVRQVFDNLLDSEQAITEVAASADLLSVFNEQEMKKLGLNKSEIVFVQELLKAAREKALFILNKKYETSYKKNYQILLEKLKKELAELPVFRAWEKLKTGEYRFNAEEFAHEYGKDFYIAFRRRFPNAFFPEERVNQAEEFGFDDNFFWQESPSKNPNKEYANPYFFALETGFKSDSEMVYKLTQQQNFEETAKQLARLQMEQDGWRHNRWEIYEALMATDEMQKAMHEIGLFIAKANNKQKPQNKITDAAVAQVVKQMTIKELVSSRRFLQAITQSNKKMHKAVVNGDFETAHKENEKVRENSRLVKKSLEYREFIRRQEAKIKRFIGNKKANPVARFLVNILASKYGFVKLDGRLADGKTKEDIESWLNQAIEDGFPSFLDESFLIEEDGNWLDMTTSRFLGLMQNINAVMQIEKQQRQITINGQKADFGTYIQKLCESLAKYTLAGGAKQKTIEKVNGIIEKFRSFNAIHRKIEAVFKELDGDNFGACWQIFEKITDAETQQNKMLKIATQKLEILRGIYSKKELRQIFNSTFICPELGGEKITKENIITLALNTGNAENLKRVASGHNLFVLDNDGKRIPDTRRIDELLEKYMTAKDWQFVQGVWDLIAEYKEPSFKLHEELTGLRPRAVTPTQRTVRTADGQIVELKGGYFPVRYNSEKIWQGLSFPGQNNDVRLFENSGFGYAKTNQGHLQERSAQGLSSPLLLEFMVIEDHIFNVIHDLTHRKPVMELNRIFKNPDFRQTFISVAGSELYKQLMPWLHDIAQVRRLPLNNIEKAVAWGRSSVSIMAMGLKATTAIVQPFGFLQSVEMLGWKYAAKGLKTVFQNPLLIPEIAKKTFNLSPFMAQRLDMKTWDRDFQDAARKIHQSIIDGSLQKIRDISFLPMGYLQLGVDLPTWWGAYEKSLDAGFTQQEAIAHADSTVRLSQGSGSIKDLSAVQRGGEIFRAFTMFYTYFNTFYNLSARAINNLRKDHTPAGVLRAAQSAMLLWFVPSILSEIVAGRGPEEDEETLLWTLKQLAAYPFQSVILFRDIAPAAIEGRQYKASSAEDSAASIIRFFRTLPQAIENPRKAVESGISAAGYAFKLPLNQFKISLFNVYDMMAGDLEVNLRNFFYHARKQDRKH